ncbi:MAG: sugar kinase [Pseudomonadota bacterium]
MSSIICAGEVMVELAREPGAASYRLDYAGDTYNTAIYLARAGCEVRYLTRLGDDKHSHAILARLTDEGLKTDEVSLDAGRSPGLYLIENDEDGERHFHYWRDNSPARQLFDAAIELPQVDAFYFSGITLAITSSGWDRLDTLLSGLRKRGTRLIFDPNYRPRLWPDIATARDQCRRVLSHCDTVLPTLEDDRALWGLDTLSDSIDFYRELGCREIAVKGDDLVATVWTPEARLERRARPVQALDTTGAGDSFNAAYLAARLAGLALEESVRAAQRLAATVVQHRGAVVPRDT